MKENKTGHKFMNISIVVIVGGMIIVFILTVLKDCQ